MCLYLLLDFNARNLHENNQEDKNKTGTISEISGSGRHVSHDTPFLV